jgi:ABC-type multidrug transport system fused ATPase/permease subunit
VLASVFLLLGSIASVAVPKLAGELIDDCINLSKFSSETAAKHRVNGAHSLQTSHMSWHCTCLGVMHGCCQLTTRVTACAEVLYKILIILSVGGLASGMRAWLFNSASERVMARLRFRLFSHLMGQEMGFFDRVRTGELMNRLSEVHFVLRAAANCAHDRLGPGASSWLHTMQDTRLMKAAGTTSISVALRSLTVSCLGLVNAACLR